MGKANKITEINFKTSLTEKLLKEFTKRYEFKRYIQTVLNPILITVSRVQQLLEFDKKRIVR